MDQPHSLDDLTRLLEPLTEREQQVLDLVAAGRSNRQIAAELFLALGTVKTHIHNIFGKLAVTSRTQALARSQQLGLIGAISPEEPQTGDDDLLLDNPYKGLRAFEEGDAADFFGREALVQHLLNRLTDPDPMARFLAVVGPSGSGKSSVLKAGVIPALRVSRSQWHITTLLPGTVLADLHIRSEISAIVADFDQVARMVLACRRGTGAVHGHIRSILDLGCEQSGDAAGCGHRASTRF